MEENVGRIEVQAIAGEFAKVDGLGSDGSLYGVSLGEESIESSPESVIVEAVGGNVPEEVGAGAFGPGGDVDKSGGLAKPGGEEKTEDTSVGVSQLGVRW